MRGLATLARVGAYLLTLVTFVVVIGRAEMVDYTQYDNDLILHFGRYKYRFLTTWNFILLTIHALLSLFCEFLLMKKAEIKSKNLHAILKLREILFTGVVFPMSLLVATVFWGLYAVDRNLIFPPFLEPVLPPFDNHALHTAIAPAVLAECLLLPRAAPASHASSYAAMNLFLALYGIPFFGTYFVHGQFLYPFVELLSPPAFVLSCLVLWAYAALLYRLQWPLAACVRPRGDTDTRARNGVSKAGKIR